MSRSVLILNRLTLCRSNYDNRQWRIPLGGDQAGEREVTQGSIFGCNKTYIINHYGIPRVFRRPDDSHAHVDGVGIIYPDQFVWSFVSRSMKYRRESKGIRTSFLSQNRTVQCTQISTWFDGLQMKQSRSFKYPGFPLDGKLSFRSMLDAQLVKLRRLNAVLKYSGVQK